MRVPPAPLSPRTHRLLVCPPYLSLTALLGPFWEVREAVHQGEERMLASAQTPDQALASAAADANQIIEEYNQRVTD